MLHEPRSRLLRRAMTPRGGWARGAGSEAVAVILEGDASQIADAFEMDTVTVGMVRAAQKEIYEASQARLRRLGVPDPVRLYRGGETHADAVFVPFTTSRRTAVNFATRWNATKGVLHTCDVPLDSVAAVVDLFQEGYDEGEVLVHRDALTDCVTEPVLPSRSDPRGRAWWDEHGR